MTPTQTERAERLIAQVQAADDDVPIDMAFATLSDAAAVLITRYLLNCDRETAEQHLAFARGHNASDLVFEES